MIDFANPEWIVKYIYFNKYIYIFFLIKNKNKNNITIII